MQERRHDSDGLLSDFTAGERQYFDPNYGVTVTKLVSGDCYVTNAADELMVTILGSCVAACIRDPANGVSGMNHFLLPGEPGTHANAMNDAARYGAYSMELLINKMMGLGAHKDSMEVKLFGGGDVTDSATMMGTRNTEFILHYMNKEGLRIASSDLGGNVPRRIHFFAADGRVSPAMTAVSSASRNPCTRSPSRTLASAGNSPSPFQSTT
jgi:chemotaxis protein CheD